MCECIIASAFQAVAVAVAVIVRSINRDVVDLLDVGSLQVIPPPGSQALRSSFVPHAGGVAWELGSRGSPRHFHQTRCSRARPTAAAAARSPAPLRGRWRLGHVHAGGVTVQTVQCMVHAVAPPLC